MRRRSCWWSSSYSYPLCSRYFFLGISNFKVLDIECINFGITRWNINCRTISSFRLQNQSDIKANFQIGISNCLVTRLQTNSFENIPHQVLVVFILFLRLMLSWQNTIYSSLKENTSLTSWSENQCSPYANHNIFDWQSLKS